VPVNSQSAAGVSEGTILAGKYRVDRVLGVGGMGVVVAARHLDLDHKVAIKFLLPALLEDHESVARFAREARAAVRITSEHVARVLDVGTLDSGAPYMVMEYLEGTDLSGWLRSRGPLPVDQAVDFLLQACVAVADAHSMGIVHRDLKPANLFCVRRNDGQFVVKVLDFGISKVTGGTHPSDSGMSVTRTSAVMGSPLYMSPEQVQSSKDVDSRTDLWALGVILFELLTASVPFPGETFGEIAVKIAVRAPLSLRACRPDAPQGLEAVMLRCLEKDRERRFANVAELAWALLPFAPERARAFVERINGVVGSSALAAGAASSSPSISGTMHAPGTMSPVGRTTAGRGRRRSRLAIIGGAAGAIAVLGAIALMATRSSRPNDADATGAATVAHADPPAKAPEPLKAPTFAPEPPPAVAVVAPEPPAVPAPVASPTPTPAQPKAKHVGASTHATTPPGTREGAAVPVAAPSHPSPAGAETVDPLKSLQLQQ
jgi:eukaryotic-like serine/threonine-protein kinase